MHQINTQETLKAAVIRPCDECFNQGKLEVADQLVSPSFTGLGPDGSSGPDKKMFMHIHGYGHCDICLPKDVQQRALAEGKAQPHRWAPEQGYVTAMVRDERTLDSTMELIRISYAHFADELTI